MGASNNIRRKVIKSRNKANKVLIPSFFVDFPLLGREVFYAGVRKFESSRFKFVVENPLTPLAYKVFLVALHYERVSLIDVAWRIGLNPEDRNYHRDVLRAVERIRKCSFTFTASRSNLLKFFPGTKLDDVGEEGDENETFVKRSFLISGTLLRFWRKRRAIWIEHSQTVKSLLKTSPKFYEIDFNDLKYLSNRNVEEMLTYLLAVKRNNRRPPLTLNKKFLLAYYLSASMELLENYPKEKALTKRKLVEKVFKSVQYSLKKLYKLGIIGKYSYEKGKIKVGNYHSNWFEKIVIA